MRHAGTNVPVTLEAQAQGYGDNTIVWVPQGIPTGAPTRDEVYSVTVSNVVVSSQSRTFTYTVTVFDPSVPALTLKVGASNTLTMSWPSSSTGYTLQQNSVLGNPGGWTNAGITPQLTGSQYVATIPLGAGQRCYRLSKP